MRSPAPLLLVMPLLACFADGGSTTFMTSSVMTGVAASTEGPTTGPGTGSSTGDPATEATTGEGPSSGAPGNCELAPECEAGAVETGELCDSCGIQRRTCQADCRWTPMACEQDLDTCQYWVLPSSEVVWQRVPVDPAAQFGPKDTVLAAIALAPQQQIYVLTATSYHVLSTVTRTWVAGGARDALLPEIAGLPLYHTAEFNAEPSDTSIGVVAGTEVFSYTFYNGKDLGFDGQSPCCGVDWQGPSAPDPYVVRDGWGRLGDPEGWIPYDLAQVCAVDEGTPLYGYNLSIGDGFVYPQDIGYCFDFYPPIPYDQFTPFTYAGRPANDLIGGAAWADGLWIFRGE